MRNERDDKTRDAKKIKGVGWRFFGSVLLFTGLLNTLITLKAGLTSDPFNYVLLISGAALMLLGYLRNREKSPAA